ncbi:MAG: ACP phosphodiesterase [Candidatus Thiodiazotropha sp.]
MNWLAHIFLSEAPMAYQHGNLLADVLKGRSWPGASDDFIAGLVMHRQIDAFTDSHPRVQCSKARLGRDGRLKGVVVDVAYDHLLVKHWSRFARPEFDDFVENFHRGSRRLPDDYPSIARDFLTRLSQTGHLYDYQSFKGIEQALWRIEQRLSARARAREKMRDYLPLLHQALPGIEVDFLAFMPELIRHFKHHARTTPETHWIL